jgi:hypothetical protein
MGRLSVGGQGIEAGSNDQKLTVGREGHRIHRATQARINPLDDLASHITKHRVAAARGHGDRHWFSRANAERSKVATG